MEEQSKVTDRPVQAQNPVMWPTKWGSTPQKPTELGANDNQSRVLATPPGANNKAWSLAKFAAKAAKSEYWIKEAVSETASLLNSKWFWPEPSDAVTQQLANNLDASQLNDWNGAKYALDRMQIEVRVVYPANKLMKGLKQRR